MRHIGSVFRISTLAVMLAVMGTYAPDVGAQVVNTKALAHAAAISPPVTTVDLDVVARPAPPRAAPRYVERATDLQKTAYVTAIAADTASLAADLYTTDRNIATGYFIEGNPVLRNEEGGLNRPVKLGLGVGIPLVSHVLFWRRGKRWEAIAADTGLAVVQSVAAGHNQYVFVVAGSPLRR